VAEQVARLQEDFKISDLLCWQWLPGMTQKQVLRSMELLADRVIPQFGSKAAAPLAAATP
jgi:hypothetical protein